MARMNCHNPFAFTPMAVTLMVTIAYLSITIPLIIIHETVPRAPSNPILYGLNTTEAWLDLAELTNGYHPYNCHRNDKVRDWLLRRIESILKNNDVAWSIETKNVRVSLIATWSCYNPLTIKLDVCKYWYIR
jgi:hypothetical protein